MKYEDVLKRFVSNQAQLLQERQLKQQLKEQMLSAKAQELRSFIPGMQGHSPEEEYTESEHNPFEEGQEFKAGGIHIDPSKKGTFKAQATRMGMSIQEAASHILNNKEKYSPAMVKKANFAKNFAKEEGGMITGDYEYPEGGTTSNPHLSFGVNANPEMGANILPSVNFQKGNFRANISTMIPVDHIERYDRNFNINADYNAGKYGDIGLSGSSYKDFEGRPTYSGSLNYEVPLTDRLNLMANLRANSLKDLKNSDASLGLRYSFENGGDMIRRADGSYSKRGLWDNIRDNAGSGKKPTKEMLEQERKIKRQYPDGGDITSILENTAGPRAEPMYVPESYETFINSERYVPGTNDKLINPATGLADKVYRNADDKMKIDYIDVRNIDGNKKFTRQEFDKFNPIHEHYQRELLKNSMDNYDTYKRDHLKHNINEELPDYPFLEDVVKQAHEHNMANGYDDTDKITSYIGNMAKEEGLDKYDLMNKYFNGYTDVAVARYLLEKYKKKVQK